MITSDYMLWFEAKVIVGKIQTTRMRNSIETLFIHLCIYFVEQLEYTETLGWMFCHNVYPNIILYSL